MKGSTLFIIFFIAFMIAKFTVPDSAKFKKYLEKEGKAENICFAGFSNHLSYYLFSIDKVSYCEPIEKVPTNTLRPLIRKPFKKVKYLGLFGTFWKIGEE